MPPPTAAARPSGGSGGRGRAVLIEQVLTPRVQSGIGLVAFSAIAWLLSERKARFPVLAFATAIALQSVLAAVFLRLPAARDSLDGLNGVVLALQEATRAGTTFLFGYLGTGEDMPFAPAAGGSDPFVFAFQALPLLVFVSALAAMLWYWGILKLVIRAFALAIARVMGTGGAVSLAAAANVLLGPTEAPLLIRPYLRQLTRSELFAVMSVGYATVAGTVMVLYAVLLSGRDPGMLGHILVASFMSLPAALLMARIMVPPAPDDRPTGADDEAEGFAYSGSLDAFSAGAVEGGKLWASVVVAILAFVALAALVNILLSGVLPDIGGAPLTLERVFGWGFAPLVWMAGIPSDQIIPAGQLMGIKTVLNEVIAYQRLAGLPEDTLDPRSFLIMVYALCGFANIGSLGIVIGGLSALEETRRPDIVSLAPRALVAGTLATLMSGAVIGVFY